METQRTTTIKDQVIWDLRDQFFGLFIFLFYVLFRALARIFLSPGSNSKFGMTTDHTDHRLRTILEFHRVVKGAPPPKGVPALPRQFRALDKPLKGI
jgi:hypothetical protein